MKKEFLKNGIYCCTDSEHKITLDPLIVASLSESGNSVCDFCSGNGIIALCMLSRKKVKKAVAVEVSKAACELCEKAVYEQKLPVEVICTDARDFSAMSKERFDIVTMNPPYYRAGSGVMPKSAEEAGQKFELCGTLAELFCAAAGVLSPGGSLIFSIKPERKDESLKVIGINGLYACEIYDIFYDRRSKPFLTVIKSGTSRRSTYEKQIYLTENGEYTVFYRELFETETEK